MIRLTYLLLLLSLLSYNTFAKDIKHLSKPLLQNVTETEATIVWTTDSFSISGMVSIAPNNGKNFDSQAKSFYEHYSNPKNVVSKTHSVRLRGLKPGCSYRYVINNVYYLSLPIEFNDDDVIETTTEYVSDTLTFTTNDINKKETSFAILNDIHGRKDTIGTLLNNAHYSNLDMVIYNGDMLSQINSKEDIYNGFVKETIDLLGGDKPLYFAMGNHERQGKAADRLHDYILPCQQHSYYTFRQGPAYFIVLDTGEDKPDSTILAGFANYDYYRSIQAEWLEGVVATEEYKKAKFHIVIAHIPPTSNDDSWHGANEVRNKFMPILNNANVDIMFCAHLHEHIYMNPSESNRFPILINSNSACVKGEIKGNCLNVKVIEYDGKTSFDKDYHARKK